MKPNKLHRLEEAAKSLPPKKPNLKDRDEVNRYFKQRFYDGVATEEDFDIFWSAFADDCREVIYHIAKNWFWARQRPDFYWTGPSGDGRSLAGAILSSTPEDPAKLQWYRMLEGAGKGILAHGEPMDYSEDWDQLHRSYAFWGHVGMRVLGPDLGEVQREVLQEQWRAEGPPPPYVPEPECECGGRTCRSCEDEILADPLWDQFQLKKDIIRQRAAEAAREALGRPKPEQ